MPRDSRVAEGVALWFFWRRIAERTRAAPADAKAQRPGVWRILTATWRRASAHNIAIIAAGVAFYAFLSIFPALAAAVSIYGLISDPAEVQTQLNALAGVVPPETLALLSEQMTEVAGTSGAALCFATIAGILLTLWSAKRGMDAAIVGLNIAFEVKETRGLVRLNLVALALAASAVIGALIIVALFTALPALLERIHGTNLAAILRWPVLLAALIAALAALYRYGPSDPKSNWRYAIVGAGIGGVLWLAASALFSLYVANFGKYNESYGSLGAIVVLMLWLYVSSYIGLLGAEFAAVRAKAARSE